MRELPEPTRFVSHASDRAKLSVWLSEWEVDHALGEPEDIPSREGEVECSSADRELFRSLVRPFDGDVSEGQVRMMSPRLFPDELLPVCLAVLRDWGDDLYLCAPFSPYQTPAVQGELWTGRVHFTQSVLQLWNACILREGVVSESWLCSELTSGELIDAFAVFRYIMTGVGLPERLLGRIGPPIHSDSDPRHAYQSIECAKLSGLFRA